MTFETFLSKFSKRKQIAGGFMVCCPAHEDSTASLSVTQGTDGRILLHDHAGCTTDAIVAAMNLTLADLFADDKTAVRVPVAIYDYVDEHGALLYQSIRYPTKPDGKKDFQQRRPDGSGGWVWKLEKSRRVVYHLDKIQHKEALFVVEGEKDADRLWSLGLPATTNNGGASNWRDYHAEQLKAAGVKRLCVLPDNDTPGENHAQQVRELCEAAGLSVRIVRLAGLEKKGDVSDWLDAGHTKAELVALSKEAFNGHGREPDATPPPSLMEPLSDVLGRVMDGLNSGERPTVCSTPYPSLNYWLDGGFSAGELIYLGARPSVGKSAIGLDIARHASKAGPVLVISREMASMALASRMLAQEGSIRASAIKRRDLNVVEASSANESMIRLAERPIWLSEKAVSIEQIADLFRSQPGAPWSLVILDYLQLIRAPKHIKEHRLALEHVSQELKTLAVECHVPVLCLSSLSRPMAGNPEPTLASLRDSGELEHDADVVLLLHRKADGDTEIQCRIAKNRSGALGCFTLLFMPDFVTFKELERGVA
jgi:replicative DNA helicase